MTPDGRPRTLATVQRRAWIIGVVTLLLTACGGGSSVNRKEVGPCPPGREISGRQLRDALRQQGFSVACLRGVYGTQMANFSPTGQGNRADHEGPVACDAHKFMPPRTEHHPHRIFVFRLGPESRPGRDLLLANIDCTLYLDSGTRPDALARIRQALNTLAAGRY
jgi:hypothetical protein